MSEQTSDVDPHTELACELFGVKPEEITPSMRQYAKRWNFCAFAKPSEYKGNNAPRDWLRSLSVYEIQLLVIAGKVNREYI